MVVQVSCNREVSRLFRSFRRNTSGLTQDAIDDLRKALHIAAAMSTQHGQGRPRFQGGRCPFEVEVRMAISISSSGTSLHTVTASMNRPPPNLLSANHALPLVGYWCYWHYTELAKRRCACVPFRKDIDPPPPHTHTHISIWITLSCHPHIPRSSDKNLKTSYKPGLLTLAKSLPDVYPLLKWSPRKVRKSSA